MTLSQSSGGGGTVTSVALTVPADDSVVGSPITSSGTLAVTRANQNANQVLAGPSSGGAGTPGYRGLVAADVPNASGLDVLNQARVYNSGAISVPNATNTALTFDTERYNPNNMHSTVTNTSRLTAQVAGVYLLTGMVSFASIQASQCQIFIRLNGTTILAAQQIDTAAGAVGANLSVATIWKLAQNDYVELVAYQNSGGAVNVQASADYSPELAAQRIG